MADNAETKIETAAALPVTEVAVAAAAPVAKVAVAPVALVNAAPAPTAAAPAAKLPVAELPAAKLPVADLAPVAVKVRKPRTLAAAKPVAAKAPKAPKVAKAPKAAKVAAAKPATPKSKTAPKAAKTANITLPSFTQIKDTIMATKNTDFTAAITTAVAGAQEKAKVAYEKSTAAFGDYNEFAKGNVEAIVESGKILANGMKIMGGALVTDGKSAIETVTADVKELTALKSPADLFKLQGDIMRRNFDALVAFGSKQTEAVMKLAGEAAVPVSNRVSIAVDKVKKAA